MEILAIIGGLVALLLVLKLLWFIPNKIYLEKVLTAMRAHGHSDAALALEFQVGGSSSQEVSSVAWRHLIALRQHGIDPVTAARQYVKLLSDH